MELVVICIQESYTGTRCELHPGARVWVRPLANGDVAVAIVNLNDTHAVEVSVALTEVRQVTCLHHILLNIFHCTRDEMNLFPVA